MAVNSVGGIGYYGATNFQAKSKVDPKRDSIFIDPRTGEKTTWKPGLYDPVAEEKRSRRKKFFALFALGALAFIFRGKIKSGFELLKAFFKR